MTVGREDFQGLQAQLDLLELRSVKYLVTQKYCWLYVENLALEVLSKGQVQMTLTVPQMFKIWSHFIVV